MNCDQFRENVELYALGALESSEANAFSEHLSQGCVECEEALRRAVDLNAQIARNVPLVDPPARLRRRIQEAVAPSSAPPRQWLGWALAVAAMLALAIGLGVQHRKDKSEAELLQMQSAEQSRLFSALEILKAPGTREVSFNDAKLPQLHAAVYIHQKLGVALIIDRLPTAPAGWKYESWIMPKSGAPEPVEPFNPDSGGRAVSVLHGPVEVARLDSIAVSMEPQDSSPKKPTTLVFKARI